MSTGDLITGTLESETLTGSIGDDVLSGLGGNDSLLGEAGNDTLSGGSGNDTVDGGPGYNTYVVTGSADAYNWTVNALGDVILTDSVTDPADPFDGSNEGVDTLRNVQLIQYVHPDGTVESTVELDDWGNSPDAGNYQIQYGQWVNGRANFYGDLDYFKLQTTAGQKVVLSGGDGSTWGYLSQNGYSIQGNESYIGSQSDRVLTYSSTGLQDVNFQSQELNSGSPMTSKGYSFILRRELDGTDGNDSLIAGDHYEQLIGGVGNDTLTGSDRSDYLSGGADNDLLTGGKGNDELDGGTGTSNIAVFSGNRVDYSATWLGENLSLRISDNVAGRDGTDTLTNVQVLRFADGDVTLDRESNTPVQSAVAIGQSINGSLPVGIPSAQRLDIDYFQQKFTADISTSTALRISVQAAQGVNYFGYLYFQFYQAGSNDALTFNNLGSSGTISEFSLFFSPGNQQSWFVSPKYWGNGSDFQGIAQRADLKVYGYVQNGVSALLGDQAGYTIQVDRVLFGTTGADTIAGDGHSGYIDARDGNDFVNGSSIAEQIIGGTGDDTLFGGAGNDVLTDGAGHNRLNGDQGDDLIDTSESAAPFATVDGGAGIDTLRIATDTSWAGLSVSNVEVLDGNGGRISMSPQQLQALGFTTAQNIIFRLDPALANGGILDASGLAGNLNLRGTNQSDLLTGNSGNNTIYLGAETNAGPGLGADTVYAGAGNDTIVFAFRPGWEPWTNTFSSRDLSGTVYSILGLIDGGSGDDLLTIDLTNAVYIYSSSYGVSVLQSSWQFDLSNLALQGIESLSFSSSTAYPSEIILSVSQVASLNSATGLRSVSIVGGGAIDLAHLAQLGITTWDLGDDQSYQISGTANNETLTVGSGSIIADLGAGNDEFVIESKALVTDTLSGGEGTDTITIRGSDVDLSGAVLTGIESIRVSSKSISMTEAQWNDFGGSVTRISGASTGYILSVTEPGTTTISSDSPYAGLTGSSGDDRLIGNAGDNILVGGAGNDVLIGNAGNDRLVTGAGTDSLSGGDGSDLLVITDKTVVHDQLDGGAGTDTLLVSDLQNLTAATLTGIEILSGSGTVILTAEQLSGFQALKGVSVQLSGASSTFSLGTTQLANGAHILLPQADTTLTATEGIIGSKGDDLISGSTGGDIIYGGRGSDHLDGAAGADTLLGGSGNDTLIGGAGDDVFRLDASELSTAYATVYSDIIDGGPGTDTLELNEGANGVVYHINPGSINNIERLVVNNYSNYWQPMVELSADTWRALTSFYSACNSEIPYIGTKITIVGNGNNISFVNIDAASKISVIDLTGTYEDIDASNLTIGVTASISDNLADNYHHIAVSNFDSMQLSSGNDYVIVNGDERFDIKAASGDDTIRVINVQNLAATIDGGSGTDTLNVYGNSFVDLTQSALTGIESVKYGSATLVVTEAQLNSLSFDGSGAKFTSTGDIIFGTAGNDSYSGNGTGSFQGGRGDDAVSFVNTVVFSGNKAEYNYTRSGTSYIVEHAYGTPVDGRDTLRGVMNIKFADAILQIDDAPDNLDTGYQYSGLTVAAYDKAVSAKKDFIQDTDVFAATLAPNSPLVIEASSSGGSNWTISFRDIATGQQLQFRSLVYGGIYWEYASWMSAADKLLPGFNTADGFIPYQGGNVEFQYNLQGAVQDYAFTLKYLDDYAGSIDTTGAMDSLVGEVRGYIGAEGDTDWVRTTLIAGTQYEFHLNGLASGGGTLRDPSLVLRDSEGRLVESGIDIRANETGGDDVIIFRPAETGSYFLAVQDVGGISLGSWTLTQKSLDMIAGNTSTTERIEWSSAQTFTKSSEVNALGDHDWFRVWLDKGLTYDFRALGASHAMGNTLGDPEISLYSLTGNLLATDNNGGVGTDARLIYRAADSGWYFIDAGASGNVTKGTYTITGSSLADDYGNSVLTNGRIQVDTPVHGLISFNGDSDWFKVGMTKGQVYIIDLTGDLSDGAQLDPLTDPMLVIRDASGTVIFKADDFGGSLNARAYFTPSADGAYYLEARSAFKYDVGAFQLSVLDAPPDDYADKVSAVSAQAAAAGQLVPGIAASGVIGVPGDHDLFMLEMEAGKVYQIKAEGLSGHAGTLADPYIRVFDAQGHLVDFANNGGAGSDAQLYFSPTVTAGFFVEVSSNHDKGLGTYQITASLRNLPSDDVPNDLTTKVFLSPGDTFAGQLLTHNDQDWFGMTLSAGQDYVFRVQASDSGNGTLIDPVLEVRAGDGSLVRSSDNSLTSHEPFMVFTPIAQGTYYLVVKAADGQTDTGSYTLVTRAPDDYSDSKSAASTLSLDQPLDGSIQWAYGSYGVRAADSVGVASDSDTDWFSFTASAGEVLSVRVLPTADSTLSRPMVEIIDADNHTLAIGDGLETTTGNAVATFKAAVAGTYYARVIDGAGATGDYQIRLSAGDASDEDSAGAVALVFASQGTVTVAGTIAKIGLTGDTDTFDCALQSGHHYRIESMAVRDGSTAPLQSASLGLSWLADGQSTAQAVAVSTTAGEPAFFDSAAFSPVVSGHLSVTVQATDSNDSGQYKLRVIDLGVTTEDVQPDHVSGYVDATHGVLSVNASVNGVIDSLSDVDLYAINLTAGNVYDFSVKSFVDGLGSLAQGELLLLDSTGSLVTSGRFDSDTGQATLACSVFADGRYYLSVGAADQPGNTGTFMLDTRLRDLSGSVVDDISSDTRSGVTVMPGRPATGNINYAGDIDWISASLLAGKVYVIDQLGDGDGAGGTLKDGVLRLLDAAGNEVALDDNSGAGSDARLFFTPQTSQTYYFEVSGNGAGTGTYTLRLRELYSGIADPMISAQWYLPALGLDQLNNQYSGAGITIGMIDDGIDVTHPDLQSQIDFALSYDASVKTSDGKHKSNIDYHGTMVAGLIVAAANNETGIVGIAPDAEIASTRVNWTWDAITDAMGKQYQFDISNNSWSAINPFGDNFNSTTLTFAYEALRQGVESGREQKGTVFIFSAGNSASSGDNTNYHNFQNAREVITVAAAERDGSLASFSTHGANVLVGAFGVGLLTTDRHEAGLGLNPSGNYASFTGTSAAAPVVSGIVALMLEANPELGYRDVQKILALTATHPGTQTWKINGATNWNLGGLEYNDGMGFGLVDAYAAVQLASTWTESSTAINEVTDSARAFGLHDVIPDGDGTACTRIFHIDNAIHVEHMELGIDLRHNRLGDIVIEVISPNGTVSRLMDRPTVNAEQPFGLSGVDSGVPIHLLWDFSSVQFMGEDAVGDWTVVVKDVRAEETGTIYSMSLRVYGEHIGGNDSYVFTEEGFKQESTAILQDESGTDTINASVMLHDTYVDLKAGLIAAEGVTYKIADWTLIEQAFTGAGNDRLVGNDAVNWLKGGAGNDTLEGGGGNDSLDGGTGHDTVVYSGAMAEYNVSFNPDTKQVSVVDNKVTGGDDGRDLLIGIERIVFSDGDLSLGAIIGNHAPVVTAGVFDNPVLFPRGMGIRYDLPENAFSDADSGSSANLQIEISAASGGELPEWLSYDPTTHQFTGVPPVDLQGQIKLLVTAIDEFGETASDILTLQFGDNQAPVLDNPCEKVIREDAGFVALSITAPVDPEGKQVTVKVLEIPIIGTILDKLGNIVSAGTELSADALSELHYQTANDANGNAGYLHYQASDEDGVTAESSVHLFVDAVNDAPRFATAGSKLVINYPTQSTVNLDMNHPVDPESTLNTVTLTELPAMGTVSLDGHAVNLNQVLTFDQLDRLSFTLSENVNGPIGAVSIQAVDPQGLATNWSLALEVQGEACSNVGTAGADTLYGSIGNDTIYGVGGNDILVGNAGHDRLLGGLGNDTLFGGSGNDALDGSSGNDYLDGGSGNDTMSGGPGADTYVVDSLYDVVLEVISGGTGGKDLVMTSVSLTAPDNVESLQAAAGYAINLAGNSLNNTLVGNELANNIIGDAGRDTLVGGAGNDTLHGDSGIDHLAGGTGDDLYHVDSRSDMVVELANEGFDTVRAACSFTLPSNVEHLVLEEGGNYTAGGNSLNNHLWGNSGNNILAGGLGSDTLEGGLGNDIYVLSDSLDTIVDTGGTDTVRSSLDITLQAGMENAELVGIGDTAAIGNGASNLLSGNSGDNVLDGFGGVDTLTGGDGSDQFIISNNGEGRNPDRITDFTHGTDLLVIDLASFGISADTIGLLSSGTVGSDAFVKGPGVSALDPNDYFLLDTAQGVLMFDPDGSGPDAPVKMVELVGVSSVDMMGEDIFVAV